MKRFLLPKATILFLLTVIAAVYPAGARADYRTATFNKLEEIREEKKNKILSWLHIKKDKVLNSRNDPVLVKAFQDFMKPPAYPQTASMWLERTNDLDEHYVTNYGEFYDILFVAANGYIFHSIKMENDFRQNLFENKLSNSRLSRSLNENPEIQFVDYDYYLPSKEPAAFFVIRINDEGNNLGWIIFQYSINAINSTLSDHSRLGRTGEVYLTNTEKIMITQSRLIPENTSLQLKIDTQAPDQALKETKGNMLIRDYRGVMVFSSYERFEFSGVIWVIIAEIDEDEIITDFYRANKEGLLKRLLYVLKPGVLLSAQPDQVEQTSINVDINEYAKAQTGQQIITYGVATCMVVIATMPDQFTYLGHIYPLDEVYRSGWENAILNFGLWMKGKDRIDGPGDLLGSMIDRIKHYDVYPYEIKKLRFVLAAVHTKGLERTIDKLLDAGIYLSQITVLHNPDKVSFNVVMNAGEVHPFFEWKKGYGEDTQWTGIGSMPDLGKQVKMLLGDIRG